MGKDYTVREGDCISSIAFENGFTWQTLWDHSSNSELKNQRKDPNVLMEGDIVHIPDLRVKNETGATDMKHQFMLKGTPAKLRLRLTRLKRKEPKPPSGKFDDASVFEEPDYEPSKPEYEPRSNVPFHLEIDSVLATTGETDDDGRIELSIAPNAREGRLILNRGRSDEEVIPLALGQMDPVHTTVGVRKRLYNLGFPCAPTGDDITPDLDDALRQFQEMEGLSVTGEIDEATMDKLKQTHGC